MSLSDDLLYPVGEHAFWNDQASDVVATDKFVIHTFQNEHLSVLKKKDLSRIKTLKAGFEKNVYNPIIIKNKLFTGS